MITYDLRCERGHTFEGWFRDAATYEKQEKRRLIACAVCGSAKIKRAPMAPAVAGTGSQNAEAPAAASEPSRAYAAHPDAQKAAALMRELKRLRDHVEKTADYVGPRFAEEARKIHYGETGKRSIYGEASDSEASALAEEGVDFARIPWVKPADS